MPSGGKQLGARGSRTRLTASEETRQGRWSGDSPRGTNRLGAGASDRVGNIKVLRAAKYIAILGLFLAAVAAVSGIVAARQYGNGAYVASAISALLIWSVGALSLLIVALAPTPQARVNAALLGMLIRMALPMVAIAYFSKSNHPLAAEGIVGLLVVHYLLGLVAETLLSVRLTSAANVKLPAAPAVS